MNNAAWGAWRSTCLTLRETRPSASQFKHPIRSLFVDSAVGIPACVRNLGRLGRTSPFIQFNPSTTTWVTPPLKRQSQLRSFHSHSSLASRSSRNAGLPGTDVRGNGIGFASRDLSAYQLSQIFGTRISMAMGNRILKVLHDRRLSGTLDLDLPEDIARNAQPHVLEKGLNWLRRNYPVDEEAAILARIEKEEQEEENRVLERVTRLGLHKPQSGKYGAELAEGGDVYGRSVLQDIRKTNEKANKKREEDDRRNWLEGEEKMKETTMKQLQKSTELRNIDATSLVEAQPRADPTSRPALAWIQRHHIRATSHDWDTTKLTKPRRILPSLAVAIVTAGLCFGFSSWYEPPALNDRLWPSLSASDATVIGIIGTNIAVFALWKCFPPAWRMLNRYFINTPIYPYSLSALGSTFSHQQFTHLGANMLILWFVGTRLHEEIGRGDFVGLYLTSGVFASLTSLSAHVIGNSLTVSSLGASGAIAGIIAAWCVLHSNDKLTFMFLPRDWQEKFSASGSTFLSTIVIIEALSLFSPFRIVGLDYWAHLGGYAAGALIAWLWKRRAERRKEENASIWAKIAGSRG